MIKFVGFVLMFCSVLYSSNIYAQKLKCGCVADKTYAEAVSCKIKQLRNHSKLYYQISCDSLWLTLQNSRGIKKVIYSMHGEEFHDLYNYNFRLGYQLVKEYKKHLLFRTGCPATGSCDFVLINKITGKKEKEFGQLIYDRDNNGEGIFYPFVIYFSKKGDKIVLDYIDKEKKRTMMVNPLSFTEIIPEYQFSKIELKRNQLILSYDDSSKKDHETSKIVIKL